jgi:hypothetical protein
LAADYRFLTYPNSLPHQNAEFFSYCKHYPDPDGIAIIVNCLIRQRISQNKTLGTATSAIWNITYLECLITFAPIFISFSLSVLNDQSLTFFGKAKRLRKLPRL